MQRIATTVLALVGAPASGDLGELVQGLGEAANVRAVAPDPAAPALERAGLAWAEATRTHTPYLVHDADPLAEVATAWSAWWDTGGDRGRLETTVLDVLQRWRAGTVELPDYYLIIEPDQWPATLRHFHLGMLAGAASHRVAVVPRSVPAVMRAVRRLPAGRWWPDLDRLLTDLDRRVPDTLRHQAASTGLVV